MLIVKKDGLGRQQKNGDMPTKMGQVTRLLGGEPRKFVYEEAGKAETRERPNYNEVPRERRDPGCRLVPRVSPTRRPRKLTP